MNCPRRHFAISNCRHYVQGKVSRLLHSVWRSFRIHWNTLRQIVIILKNVPELDTIERIMYIFLKISLYHRYLFRFYVQQKQKAERPFNVYHHVVFYVAGPYYLTQDRSCNTLLSSHNDNETFVQSFHLSGWSFL